MYTLLTHMNTNIKVLLSVVLIALALYGAFFFGRSAMPTSDNNMETATSTEATSTGVVSTKPTNSGVVSTKPTTSNTLVKIDYRGGVCPNGKTCMTSKVITKDSVYYKDGAMVSNINKNDVAKLTLEMERADWTKLRSKPKTTGCDLVRTQEIVYSFYTKNGLQVVSNCQHDFDITLPLFQIIATLLPQ